MKILAQPTAMPLSLPLPLPLPQLSLLSPPATPCLQQQQQLQLDHDADTMHSYRSHQFEQSESPLPQHRHIGGGRVKCGIVYTWDCTGEELEQFAVECALCHDRPICKLSEFALHMEIWHQQAEETERILMAIDFSEHIPMHIHQSALLSPAATTAAAASPTESPITSRTASPMGSPTASPMASPTTSTMASPTTSPMASPTTPLPASTPTQSPTTLSPTTLSPTTPSPTLSPTILSPSPTTPSPSPTHIEPFEQVLMITNAQQQLHMRAAVAGDDDLPLGMHLNDNDDDDVECCDALLSDVRHMDDVVVGVEELSALAEHVYVDGIAGGGGVMVVGDDDDDDDAIADTTAANVDYCAFDPTTLNANQQIQFALNEPLTHSKLTTAHIERLIELYEAEPRLWRHTHSDYHDREGNRRAWQRIAYEWSAYCGRAFSRKEVHMRLATLYKRYQQQCQTNSSSSNNNNTSTTTTTTTMGLRERCFKYFEKMQFLRDEQPFLTRRSLAERENVKLLEIYAHFPLLWHRDARAANTPSAAPTAAATIKATNTASTNANNNPNNSNNNKKQQQQRIDDALRNISTALALCNIQMTAAVVRRRLKTLHTNYRNEKLRHLHCKLERRTFVTRFKHYAQMAVYLDEHVEPFVCATCGKIYQRYSEYRVHCNNNNDCCANSNNNNNNTWQQQQVATITTTAATTTSCNTLTAAALQALSSTSTSASLSSSSTSSALSTTSSRSLSSMLESTDSAIDVHTPSEQNSTTTEQLELEYDDDEAEAEAEAEAEDGEELQEETGSNASANTFHINATHQTTITATATTTTTTTTKTPNGKRQDNDDVVAAYDNEDGGAGDDELLVKVDCGPFSFDFNLLQQQQQQQHAQTLDATDGKQTQIAETTTTTPTMTTPTPTATVDHIKIKTRTHYARLNVQQTRRLIALYRDCVQLWDPAHVAYASRKARAVAWRTLTLRMNRKCGSGGSIGGGGGSAGVGVRYTWRTLHRKITDFIKYYKRERQRHDSKWYFYNDFRFIDKALNATSPLQRSLQHKANNLKIIAAYRTCPQLWNTQHAAYSKRQERQREFARLRQRLHDEAQLPISVEQLKQRLIDFRCNYRLEKQQRLAAGERGETFSSHYEFYDELAFLEAHVAPFQCVDCNVAYKRRSEYVQHVRKVHASMAAGQHDATTTTTALTLTARRVRQRRRRCAGTNATATVTATADIAADDAALEHVCHICGMAFTARNNLVYHLKRHLGERQHGCHLCPKVFYNSTSLRVHVRSHTKELPYICELCGARFVNASKLNQHRKRHTNQRDYACDKCEKTYYTAFELDRHQRRHLNIRDKICPICGRAFFVGSAYYAHMRLHSDVKRYACEMCDMKFAQYAGLYKHRKRHHAV